MDTLTVLGLIVTIGSLVLVLLTIEWKPRRKISTPFKGVNLKTLPIEESQKKPVDSFHTR